MVDIEVTDEDEVGEDGAAEVTKLRKERKYQKGMTEGGRKYL